MPVMIAIGSGDKKIKKKNKKIPEIIYFFKNSIIFNIKNKKNKARREAGLRLWRARSLGSL